MKLLVLLVLLSALTSLAVMEVVTSFRKCPGFFIGNQVPTPPKWGHQKKICQRWLNKYQYATLFDTQLRIPVYSAYTFPGYVPTHLVNEWKNEPQLEKFTEQNKEMEWITNNTILQTLIHQAINADYADSGYTRGHVFPNIFAINDDQSDSTCTFTNLAPQTENSNNAWAQQVEQPMLRVIEQNCQLVAKTPAYIVTGVVPGTNWIPIKRGNKTYEEGVNIPSYYWTAFCCTNAMKIRVSSAYLAQQNQPQNPPAVQMTVEALNVMLSRLYDTTNYSVFGNEC